MDGAEDALVIGGGDDDAIDILRVEQGAVIVVDAPVDLALGDGLVGSFGVAVGEGDDLRAGRKLVHQEVGAAAGADDSDAYAVVGSEDAAGKDEGCGGGEQRSAGDDRVAHD